MSFSLTHSAGLISITPLEGIENFMGNLYRKAYTVLNNPMVFGTQFIQELYYDYIALTGRVSYRNHLIFIAGLPKSGTSWLEKLISEVPGYKIKWKFFEKITRC